METVSKCCFMCWIKYSDRKKRYFCAVVFRAPAAWSWGKAVCTLPRRPSLFGAPCGVCPAHGDLLGMLTRSLLGFGLIFILLESK